MGSNPLRRAKKSKSTDLDFFIHCESNGISSAVRLYIINNGYAVVVSHHTSWRVTRNAFAMMIYKAFRFDDMQFLAELVIYNAAH